MSSLRPSTVWIQLNTTSFPLLPDLILTFIIFRSVTSSYSFRHCASLSASSGVVLTDDARLIDGPAFAAACSDRECSTSALNSRSRDVTGPISYNSLRRRCDLDSLFSSFPLTMPCILVNSSLSALISFGSALTGASNGPPAGARGADGSLVVVERAFSRLCVLAWSFSFNAVRLAMMSL